MPAEVLFAGGKLDSVRLSGTVTESTGAGNFDATYCDSAILIGSGGAYVIADFFTETSNILSPTTVVSGESLWFHYECINPGANWPINTDHLTIYDSSGFPWFRLRVRTSTGLLGAEYNSGTGASPVWTTVGATFGISASLRFAIDLKLTLGSPHSFEVSYDGSLQISGTFTQALFTNAANALINPRSNSSTGCVSQLLATRDIPTIGAKVRYARATANGTNTAWAGAFSDVNEVVGSDATVNSSSTSGQKETHAMGDVTVPSGFEIKAVFHWLRAKNDGSAPNNIKSVLRSGGVDYSTGNLSGIGVSYSCIGARYTQDPATAANWTQSGWNAVEAGYESAT